MTRPKARPIEIQTADSTAASLVVTTWASLCTTMRSTSKSTTTSAAKAAHAQPGVENDTKFSEVDSEATERLRLRGFSTVGGPTSRTAVGAETAVAGASP